MRKLFLVLVVIILAAFLLVGCLPFLTPGEGEGEGESEGESEITVVIDSAVFIDGKTYVSGGYHDITVTFPAPVANGVDGWLSNCEGYYGADILNDAGALNKSRDGGELILFPDATKKVWTGSAYFGCMLGASSQSLASGKPNDFLLCSPCCASILEFATGECEDETCISLPVIVDSCPPYAEIEISTTECTCAGGGCTLSFASTETSGTDCIEGEACCGDDCSGLDSWAINLYGGNPFDSCCDPSLCEEPITTGSGIDCPIDFTTGCLEAGTYYAVIRLVDKVGLEETYYAKIELTGGMTTIENLCLPETVGIRLTVPSVNSYFNTTVSNAPVEYDYLNDAFNGWCADDYTYISVNTAYGTTYIYSSLDKVNPPECILSRPWGSVNWLLNHWTTFTPPNAPLTWQDVQVTIWELIHVGLSPDICILQGCPSFGNSLSSDADNVLSLYTAAYAHSDYVPGSDELVAVILLVNNVCPDGDTNTGNNDPNAKQMTFFGIPKNELYCESETIDLPCSITVSEGFEIPAPDCITWTETDNTIGTCGAICLAGAIQVIVEP